MVTVESERRVMHERGIFPEQGVDISLDEALGKIFGNTQKGKDYVRVFEKYADLLTCRNTYMAEDDRVVVTFGKDANFSVVIDIRSKGYYLLIGCGRGMEKPLIIANPTIPLKRKPSDGDFWFVLEDKRGNKFHFIAEPEHVGLQCLGVFPRIYRIENS